MIRSPPPPRRAGLLAAAAMLALAAPARAQGDTVPLKPLEVRSRRLPLAVTGAFLQAVDRNAALAAPVRASGRRRGIQVQGAMPTPSGCYRLSGAADRSLQLVILNIQARPTGEPCPADAGPEAFTYRVKVRLPRGSYTLRVLHTYRYGRWEPRMALDTTVTVP